jgi:predicted DNA-binding transcriptional regulator YafY
MPRNSELIRYREMTSAFDGSEADRLPEPIVIEFDVRIAEYIRSRDWHPTGTIRTDVDGSVRLTLHASAGRGLRSWILSFGPLARVIAPTSLAEQILEELEAAREKYAPRMDFELPIISFDDLDAQDTLPLGQPG